MPLKIQKNSKLIDTPIGFTCDCCKYYVPFSMFRTDGINTVVSDPEFIAIEHQFGYGSSVDGMKVDLSICEPCFETYCENIDAISTKVQVCGDEDIAKPILYIDMNDTI